MVKINGTDQLRSYHEADLLSLFSHMQIVGFPMQFFIYVFIYQEIISSFTITAFCMYIMLHMQ